MSTASQTALTGQQLVEIRARVEAATPGPWCTDDWEIYQGTEYLPEISEWIGETCRGKTTYEQDRSDATFIATARTDVPALLDEVERLQRKYAFDTAELKRKNAESRTVIIAEVRRALLGTTDGDEVDDAFEIPAGEISRILHELAGGAA